MKFVSITDRDGKAYVLNPAHIVMLTTRSGRGSDWSEGAWVYLSSGIEETDPIALGEKDATDLLGKLM